MRTLRRSSQGSSRAVFDYMAAGTSPPDGTNSALTWQQAWQHRLRWVPTSKEAIIASDRRLLSLVKDRSLVY
ncbi:hypothetical protein L7F22_001787 [Adiantum nelumboides]|nr:hypothetical protein [Adiantum nelumboides]